MKDAAPDGPVGDEPLVMLPGMLCDERLWAPVTVPAGRQVVHCVPEAPRIDAAAASVLAAVEGPFALAGLSLGAIVGFEVLRQAPERVTAFLAVSTNASAPRPEQYAAWREMAATVRRGRFDDVVDGTLRTMFADPHPAPRSAARYREMARAVGPRTLLTQLAAQATRVDAHSTLRGVRCPAVVLGGARDALCPPEFHRAIADALPRSTLRIVPGCGHLLPWEAPEAVSAALRDVLGRSARATGSPAASADLRT